MTQISLDDCLLFTVLSVWYSSVIAEGEMKETFFRLHGMAVYLVYDVFLTVSASFAAAKQTIHARSENTTSKEKEQSELAYAGATIILSTPPGTVRVFQMSYISNLARGNSQAACMRLIRT
jgi:hypothetical protein